MRIAARARFSFVLSFCLIVWLLTPPPLPPHLQKTLFTEELDDFYTSPLHMHAQTFPGQVGDVPDLPPVECFALPDTVFQDLPYLTAIVLDQVWANSTWSNGVVRNLILPVGVSVMVLDLNKMDHEQLVG